MKKIVSLILAACLALSVTAFAAGSDYTFTLRVDGSPTVGDTVTVRLRLAKSGGGDFDLYAMQDYVCFDSARFQYVEGSLATYSDGNGAELFSAAPLDYDEDGVIDRVFVNRASLSAVTLPSDVEVLRFQMKARTAGAAALTQRGVEIFQDPANPFSHSAPGLDLTVLPSSGGGGGGGGGGTTPPEETITVPVRSEQGGIQADATVSEGSAAISVSDQELEEVLADGKDVGTVTVDISGLKDVTSAVIPAGVAEKVGASQADGLRVALPTGSVTLDKAALGVTSGRTLTASVTPVAVSSLSPDLGKDSKAAKLAAVDVGLLLDDVRQSRLPGGKLTVGIPCAPKQGAKLAVWAVQADGSVQVLQGKYDAQSQSFLFETDRLGRFVLVDEAGASGFVDVPAGSFCEDAVAWAVANGITKGTTETTFSPGANCTRGQAVTFLHRAAGCPAPKSTVMPFTDVAQDSYCYEAVLWAVENGITKGTTETTFSPNQACSRGHIVTFLHRAQNSPAAGTANPFTDVPAGAFYTNAVLWAVEKGVTTGTTPTTFSPGANCSRGQIVTFLYRALA